MTKVAGGGLVFTRKGNDLKGRSVEVILNCERTHLQHVQIPTVTLE